MNQAISKAGSKMGAQIEYSNFQGKESDKKKSLESSSQLWTSVKGRDQEFKQLLNFRTLDPSPMQQWPGFMVQQKGQSL